MALPNFETNQDYAVQPAEDEEVVIDPVTGERGVVKKALLGGLVTGVGALAYKNIKEHKHKKDEKQQQYCTPQNAGAPVGSYPQQQYQPPQQQYQAPRYSQPQYQAPQYQAPQYQTPQYSPQQSSSAAPQYGPQSIQYQPQSQSQYRPQYPTYATNQNQYASASQVSGGYRQPSQGLYASAQTNVPQRLEPAFPDFFKQSSQPAPQQYRPQQQQQSAPQYQYQAPQQQYQPQQYQAPQQQYQPQQYQQQAPQQQYQAPRQASAPAFTPAQSIGGKKKIEDGQYDPELTKASLYYPELYEKVSYQATKKQ